MSVPVYCRKRIVRIVQLKFKMLLGFDIFILKNGQCLLLLRSFYMEMVKQNVTVF